MDDKLTFLLFLLAPPFAGGLLALVFFFRYSRKTASKSGWKRVLAINVFACLGLLALSFLGGELYYRFVFDTTDSIAYTKIAQRWMQRYCVFNAAGFRDNVQYALEIEPGKRRISFVGDSFTAGHGIKSVEGRFPNLIRAAHPEWEVHVLAKFGLDTGGELDLLKQSRAEGYQFDQVVLVYCLNDVADLFPDLYEMMNQVFADANRGGWLRRHSYFVDTVYHRHKAARDPVLKNYFSFVREGYRDAMWNAQRERLKALRDFVHANGGRLLVVTFPFIHAAENGYEYKVVHEQLGQLWTDLGVPHLDLLPVLQEHPSAEIVVNPYDAHPNEFANQLVAKAIDQFLSGQMTESVRSPKSPTN